MVGVRGCQWGGQADIRDKQIISQNAISVVFRLGSLGPVGSVRRSVAEVSSKSVDEKVDK